jgi:hypothetical protein
MRGKSEKRVADGFQFAIHIKHIYALLALSEVFLCFGTAMKGKRRGPFTSHVIDFMASQVRY